MTLMAKYRHDRVVGLYGISLKEDKNKINCYILMEKMEFDLETLIYK
jgi:hypothetical protein